MRNGKSGSVDELNMLDDGYKGCPIYIRPHWYSFKTVVYNYMRQFKSVADTTKPSTNYQYLVVKQLGAYSSINNANDALKQLKKSDPTGYYKVMRVTK